MDFKQMNPEVIAQFRAGGAFGRMPRDRMVLLTTTGAKSGRPHTAPMIFVPDGDRLLVVASNMGAPRHPDWYVNLLANPHVTIEVADQTYPGLATPLPPAERDEVWAKIKAGNAMFADHEAKAHRTIPVVALTPVSTDSGVH